MKIFSLSLIKEHPQNNQQTDVKNAYWLHLKIIVKSEIRNNLKKKAHTFQCNRMRELLYSKNNTTTTSIEDDHCKFLIKRVKSREARREF